MFDWLFGNSTQKQLDESKKQLRAYQNDIDTNRYMGNAISQILSDPANADLVSKISSTNPTFSTDMMNQAMDYRKQANFGDQDYKTMLEDYNKLEKKNRYNYFGDGILGAILNPIAQTATGIGDLVTGQYQANDRDIASDLGAAAETALTFIPVLGGASKALKLGKVGGLMSKAGNMMNSTKGMIATGGLFGGADALRQGGSETSMGDFLTGAGTGAAFSAAIPFGSRLLRNRGSRVINNAMTGSGIPQDVATQVVGALPNRALYQNALKSFIPKTTVGKVALGAGALYGGNKLLSGFNQQPDYNSYSMMANGGY